MPELPEVETVCRGLAQHLPGKRIRTVTARRRDLRTPLPDTFEASIGQSTVMKVSRRAKYVLMHLDNGQVLAIHLGMSGSLVLHTQKPEQYRKHDHVIIEFSPFMLMTFHDPRRFGLMALLDEETFASDKLFSGLGPEPLDAAVDEAVFYKILQSSKAPVKSVIMDQRKLVGVGNIYACEALFRARIHPSRPAHDVTEKEAGLLINTIKQVLEEAIASGGSTLRDYVRSSGDTGYFQHHFAVYGRANSPCPVCAAPLATLRQSDRSTFFCGTCQK